MSDLESGGPGTGPPATNTPIEGGRPPTEAVGEAAAAGSPAVAPPGLAASPSPPKPRIGDTRPAPAGPRTAPAIGRPAPAGTPSPPAADSPGRGAGRGRGNGSRGPGNGGNGGHGAGGGTGRAGAAGGLEPADRDERPLGAAAIPGPAENAGVPEDGEGNGEGGPRRSRGRRRGGRDRRGKSVGRYLVAVHVQPNVTQISMLEGRTLVEHYVARAADETTQIDGNIYRGRVQNVLPGMEAAFVDIGIPKNAVLYRGDVRYDRDDIEGGGQGQGSQPRIEEVLKAGQTILCQVTKNPIGAKGARLTQEVSLPGRFAVLVPNSSAFGISKRLGDNERRRLRRIVDEVRPAGHGLIVRTAAEGATEDELRRDVNGLMDQWKTIEAEAARSDVPGLLYREPDLAVRILREELNSEYRGVVIDDRALYEQVRDYVGTVSPELAERVELYDAEAEGQPIFDRYHVHEQLHKALDRKVWLPSGGSLIIERTEALTVIDVNTGKNVGKTNLEETVFRNNLEAAEEVARQLRLRDIGGIIVIDFIDMEIRENRDKVAAALRNALGRDKTRTQVFDISELGLVEMTRKRISEGLIESLSTVCEVCHGRGIILDQSVL